MPELPEVKALSQEILRKCKGAILETIEIVKGRYRTHGPPEGFQTFTKRLPLTLTDVIHKGKVMVLCFESDGCMISRLGLTGWWYINDDKPSWIHSEPNVVFEFKGLRLNYVDQLSYGTLTFLDREAMANELAKIAPDYTTLTLKELRTRLAKRPRFLSKPIEEVIVDQHGLVSGIGNYLKAEILYDSKISPLRLLETLTDDDWKAMLRSAKKLTKQIEKHIGDETKYMNTMKIYMKDKDPYGNTVVTHKTKSGRTTHWVKEVQR